MTPPKPVDLEYIKSLVNEKCYTHWNEELRICELSSLVPDLIAEIEHLRARVKELEDGRQ